MGKRATTLDDFGDKPEKIVFPVAHMEEFASKLKEKFGEFSSKGLNRFYQKANIAKIIWGIKQKDSEEIIRFPSGNVRAIYHYPNMQGQRIWKTYLLETEYPFTFWEELYYQTCRHFAKIDFIDQKKLEGLQQLADSIGEEVYE